MSYVRPATSSHMLISLIRCGINVLTEWQCMSGCDIVINIELVVDSLVFIVTFYFDSILNCCSVLDNCYWWYRAGMQMRSLFNVLLLPVVLFVYDWRHSIDFCKITKNCAKIVNHMFSNICVDSRFMPCMVELTLLYLWSMCVTKHVYWDLVDWHKLTYLVLTCRKTPISQSINLLRQEIEATWYCVFI